MVDLLERARARSTSLTFEDFVGLHTLKGWRYLAEINAWMLALDEHQYLFSVANLRQGDARRHGPPDIHLIAAVTPASFGGELLSVVVEIRNKLDVVEVTQWYDGSGPIIEMQAGMLYMTREDDGSLALEFGQRIMANPDRVEFYADAFPPGTFPDYLQQVDPDELAPMSIVKGERPYEPKGSVSQFKSRGLKRSRRLGRL